MDFKTRLALLRQRLNDNPQDLEAATALGDLCYDQGEAVQAIVYYRVALDLDPTQPAVRTDLGTMYWRNENIALAEQAFRRVIAEHPEFASAYVNLGLLLYHVGNDPVQARRLWRTAIERCPGQSATERARQFLEQYPDKT